MGNVTFFFVTGMHMLDNSPQNSGVMTTGVEIHEFLNQRLGDPRIWCWPRPSSDFSDFVAEHRPDLSRRPVISGAFGLHIGGRHKIISMRISKAVKWARLTRDFPYLQFK
jgi:hypothetical protein